MLRRRPMGRGLSSRPVGKSSFSKLARSIGPSGSDRRGRSQRGRSPRKGPVGLKRKGRGKGLRVAPRPKPERTLEEEPLFSGGTRGPLSLQSSWEEKLYDPLRRGFVSFRGGAFEEAKLRKWWSLLADGIKWEKPRVGQRLLPRSAAWLTTESCTCEYKYGATAWPTRPMEQWFLDLTDEVCRACGVRERPNSCNANFYEDGGESVGWHADDEALFEGVKRDTLIISLSLGEGRTFELCPNDAPEDVTSILLRNGDICTMEGLVQRHYKHRVPREPRVRKPRINLTWRWVVAHDRGCSAAGRSPVLVSGVPAAEAVDADEEERRKKRSQQFADARAARGVREVPASRPSEAPMSSEELAKRKRRAERFGTESVSADTSNGSASAARATAARIEVRSPPVVDKDDGEESAKRRKRAEKFGLSPAVRQEAASPQVVDVTRSEEAEAKRKRAEKFGSPPVVRHEVASPQLADVTRSEEAEARRKRAERFGASGGTSKDVSSGAAMAAADGVGAAAATNGTSEEELKRQQRAQRFSQASATKPAIPDSVERAEPVSTIGVDSKAKLDADGPTEPKALSELSELEKRKLRAARWK